MQNSALLHDLAAGGIGACATIAIEAAYRKIQRWRQATLFTRAWSFLCEPTAIVIPLIPASPILGSAGIGDLLAMSLVIRLSEAHFQDRAPTEVVKITNERAFDSDKHLVVIGGGKFNPLFRALVSELNVPLHFHDTDTESFEEIRNADSSTTFRPSRASDGSLLADTGIAVRAKRGQRWVVIAAGSNTYGSEAAMHYLTSEEFLRDLPLDKNVEIVVRARVREHTVSDVKAETRPVFW